MIQWLWILPAAMYSEKKYKIWSTSFPLAWNENGGLDRIRVSSYKMFTLPAFKTLCNLSQSLHETLFKIRRKIGDRQRSRYIWDNTLQGPPCKRFCVVNMLLLSAVTETHSAIRLSKEGLLPPPTHTPPPPFVFIPVSDSNLFLFLYLATACRWNIYMCQYLCG